MTLLTEARRQGNLPTDFHAKIVLDLGVVQKPEIGSPPSLPLAAAIPLLIASETLYPHYHDRTASLFRYHQETLKAFYQDVNTLSLDRSKLPPKPDSAHQSLIAGTLTMVDLLRDKTAYPNKAGSLKKTRSILETVAQLMPVQKQNEAPLTKLRTTIIAKQLVSQLTEMDRDGSVQDAFDLLRKIDEVGNPQDIFSLLIEENSPLVNVVDTIYQSLAKLTGIDPHIEDPTKTNTSQAPKKVLFTLIAASLALSACMPSGGSVYPVVAGPSGFSISELDQSMAVETQAGFGIECSTGMSSASCAAPTKGTPPIDDYATQVAIDLLTPAVDGPIPTLDLRDATREAVQLTKMAETPMFPDPTATQPIANFSQDNPQDADDNDDQIEDYQPQYESLLYLLEYAFGTQATRDLLNSIDLSRLSPLQVQTLIEYDKKINTTGYSGIDSVSIDYSPPIPGELQHPDQASTQESLSWHMVTSYPRKGEDISILIDPVPIGAPYSGLPLLQDAIAYLQDNFQMEDEKTRDVKVVSIISEPRDPNDVPDSVEIFYEAQTVTNFTLEAAINGLQTAKGAPIILIEYINDRNDDYLPGYYQATENALNNALEKGRIKSWKLGYEYPVQLDTTDHEQAYIWVVFPK